MTGRPNAKFNQSAKCKIRPVGQTLFPGRRNGQPKKIVSRQIRLKNNVWLFFRRNPSTSHFFIPFVVRINFCNCFTSSFVIVPFELFRECDGFRSLGVKIKSSFSCYQLQHRCLSRLAEYYVTKNGQPLPVMTHYFSVFCSNACIDSCYQGQAGETSVEIKHWNDELVSHNGAAG